MHSSDQLISAEIGAPCRISGHANDLASVLKIASLKSHTNFHTVGPVPETDCAECHSQHGVKCGGWWRNTILRLNDTTVTPGNV